MCSIVASFDIEKIKELVELNRYRGEFSHSISYIDPERKKFLPFIKKLGKVNLEDIHPPRGYYIIVHQQAPTGNTSEICIHPAEYQGNYLYHNGILKQSTIDKLALSYYNDIALLNEDPLIKNSFINWDTYLLCIDLTYNVVPENIDGSFACLFFMNKRLYIFRNEIAPLWYDDEYTFSSTRFINSKMLEPNKMLELIFPLGTDWKTMFIHGRRFETMENPYSL